MLREIGSTVTARGHIKLTLQELARHAGPYQKAARGVLVLCYHSIDTSGKRFSITPRAFAAQMSYLIDQGAKFITAGELGRQLASGHVMPGSVCITFDDGIRSTLEPLTWLLSQGCRCSIYVVGKNTGRSNWIRDTSAGQREIFSWDEIRQLDRAGAEIGSHSLTHPNLARISSDQLVEELVVSRDVLRHEVGHDVTTLCYPYGAFNARVIRAARAAGYQSACTAQAAYAGPGFHQLMIPRLEVSDVAAMVDLYHRRSDLYFQATEMLLRWKNRHVVAGINRSH